MPPSGCTAAGLLQTGRRPAYAARVCKAVHTLAALLRRRSPAPIRSAYAARIRCSSPATAAMAKSRSRLSRCSFTDYADYDLAGPPPAVLELISIAVDRCRARLLHPRRLPPGRRACAYVTVHPRRRLLPQDTRLRRPYPPGPTACNGGASAKSARRAFHPHCALRTPHSKIRVRIA